MYLFTGFFHRLGVAVKGFGERSAHKRRCYAGAFIRLGCAIRDTAAAGIRI
jgi:hypothetical protein